MTRRRSGKAVLAPYSLWALLFIVVPLVFVAYYAFTDNDFAFTFENVSRFFTATSQVDGAEVRTYLLIFWRSLKLAVISTVICLLLGYPLAYIMARAGERAQKIMMILIMIPMWMNAVCSISHFSFLISHLSRSSAGQNGVSIRWGHDQGQYHCQQCEIAGVRQGYKQKCLNHR